MTQYIDSGQATNERQGRPAARRRVGDYRGARLGLMLVLGRSRKRPAPQRQTSWCVSAGRAADGDCLAVYR